MKSGLLALLIFTCAVASASDDLLPFRKLLNAQSKYLGTLPASPRSAGCQARYDRLWKDKVLRFDWFYGYLDSGDIAMDRLMRKETLRSLQLPCAAGAKGACGFKIIKDESKTFGPITLVKTLPDGRRFEIRTWNSSYGDLATDNTYGRGRFTLTNRIQREKSRKVQAAYLNSIQNSEVVVYDGHSRHGSGPGFGPYGISEMVTGTLFEPSWKKTLYALKTAKKKPEMLMFSSCKSQDYYLPELEKAAPRTAIAATEFSQTFGVGEQMIFSTIDSLATGRCEDDFNQALRSTKGTDGAMHLFHFDGPAPRTATKPLERLSNR